jgi:hypothetical protein|tara:strand:+ start:45 stop:272 length:228 start_codon:yes stop_codon:yes gene_type:complete
MFIQIAPRVRVFISESQLEFIEQHSQGTFRDTDLSPEEVKTVKVLADKAIFVRKKLDNGMQYALNRSIRFVKNAN